MGQIGWNDQASMESEVAYGWDVQDGRGLVTSFSRIQSGYLGKSMAFGTEYEKIPALGTLVPLKIGVEAIFLGGQGTPPRSGLRFSVSLPFRHAGPATGTICQCGAGDSPGGGVLH